MIKVAVGASSFAQTSDAAERLLEEHGIEIIKNPYGRKLTEEETIEHIKDADGLLAGLEPLNEKTISEAKKLKAIARIGIGMDNVDMDACKRRGIKVSNTPDAPTDAVAEMALAALLAIAHNIIPHNRDLHEKRWIKRIGFSLMGCRILIIGYGRIGRKFASHLKAMGSNIEIYDPYASENSVNDLDLALQNADVISLNAAGNDEILTRQRLTHIKKGAVILNCARGGLINEDGVYEGLKRGDISYYWADVFNEEPYTGRLIELENAILTPHISTYNSLCRKSMELEAARNILEDLGIEAEQ